MKKLLIFTATLLMTINSFGQSAFWKKYLSDSEEEAFDGDTDAQVWYGMTVFNYFEDEEPEPSDEDKKQALQFLSEAAIEGNNGAAGKLAKVYFFGEKGVPMNWDLATAWYEQAAKNGDQTSAMMAAILLHFNFGFYKTQAESIKKAMDYLKPLEKMGLDIKSVLKPFEDIKNKKYYVVKESKSGNKLFIEQEDLSLLDRFPSVLKYGYGYKLNVKYHKATEGKVQIFPSSVAKNHQPYPDEIRASSYAPSTPMEESDGSFEYLISNQIEKGYIGIGYSYITMFFQGGDYPTIKVPVAICWLPKDYPKDMKSIDLTWVVMPDSLFEEKDEGLFGK